MDEMTGKNLTEKNGENAKPKRRNYARRPRAAKQAPAEKTAAAQAATADAASTARPEKAAESKPARKTVSTRRVREHPRRSTPAPDSHGGRGNADEESEREND